ncbi:spinster family MFS transporter [Rhizorhabdus wittichii]|uniref:spinster family MFS transporter n=1 Tax=Rhizorhabdus wittichii TaxID=160791 RepID=UPI0002FDE502|nr:MFS transporter [Rhizorhabdus wittichii]
MSFSPIYRRYSLAILFLIYTLNFLDRQIVNILAEPIKRDLHLTDWQLGSLTGLAFATFYATLALPIARLAERHDRVKIIAASTVIWSLFTGLCGLAHSFLHLFLARIGVGVGEAGCTPASHSLISDYVPREKRASAMATFSLGIPAGSLIGMTIGGLIADSFGWRAAFLVVGLPGVILGCVALFTLPEPRRSMASKVATASSPSLRAGLNELRRNRTYIWLTAAMSAMAFVTYGHFAFLGSFFLRNHNEDLVHFGGLLDKALGLSLGPVGFMGTALGLIFGIFGAAGTWLGGALTDRAASEDVRAYATVPAIAAFLLPPSMLATYLTSGALAALALLSIPILLQAIYYGPLFASVQSLVQPSNRATAAAILLFFANLIGLGLGPLTVGLLSDLLATHVGSASGIRWSLIISSFVYIPAAGAFLMAHRTIREDMVS